MTDHDEAAEAVEKKRGKGKLLVLLLAAAGAAGFMLKKKRDQELDEALWEEPRAL